MPFLRLLLGGLSLFVNISRPILAQVVWPNGAVQAHCTGQPPFIALGGRSKSASTVADAPGAFALPVSMAHAHDTLTFSAMCHPEQGLPPAQLATNYSRYCEAVASSADDE